MTEDKRFYIKIDGKKVFFVRSDSSFVDTNVGRGGIDGETGEVAFYEIRDSLNPILHGKAKYKRIIIRRVFPVLLDEERN